MPHSPDHSSYLLWLPKEVKEKLVNLAHDDRMSLNAKINQLIINEIKKRERVKK